MSPEDPKHRRSRLALAALMLGTGALHFAAPRPYEALIPTQLPGSARAWVYGSGVAELAAGALVANRKTERLGAWVTFAVFVGVYPGNIYDSIQHPPTNARGILSALRLPMQIPMFLWALRHTRTQN